MKKEKRDWQEEREGNKWEKGGPSMLMKMTELMDAVGVRSTMYGVRPCNIMHAE